MKIIKKYQYAIFILAYAILYMIFFQYLEARTNITYHIIHSDLDNFIPFCEYFIVPYYLWFPYITAIVFYFVVINRNPIECRQLLIALTTGMTLFLLISFLYPNGLELRPETFAKDNIFIYFVQLLYKTDTPTNVLPSIHVYNSVTIYLAIANCPKLKKHPVFCQGALILTILIVLSTMFLKQHSIVDVTIALLLSGATYILIYQKAAFKNLQEIKQQF